ncbi:hypothetical protein HMPREF2564_11880 [Staphylococcus sp. HMSC068D03]|uniref:DUF697 domain-containing protein n=1 Tax=Staphylococcus TaxID=1279 RepID=UPI0008A4BB18|nr:MULTISPECIES: DUF697 domain-containing protein [Staphylococcus]MCH4355043.1 DUF697 domain-containing protein [Staphylococcus haemolyticus]OFN95266.1 hypothetical protein HMPREF2620_04980 [Staphylococcus sp. HMSC077B09]OFV30915.1 hypothetical protein HMPREF3134_01415 [Staphylococcus sp. HMSC14D10]OHP83143.1 hypothetical protein HMPREF2544_10170 [Staphylococcus sp. HMSC063A11]OHQ30220.1 hypothetical protein HMPREF2564_11880 [Staphylococcus sp. HMSC068D03]
MGIMNRFSSGVTNKVGNKVLNIEEIKEKSILPTTKEEIAERRVKAETIVKKKSLLSSGMSVVPIPGLDFGVDIKLMRDIIEDINKIYGLDHKQVNTLGDDVKERILAAAAIQGSSFIGRKVSSAVLKVIIRDMAKRAAAKQTKWFPVVGQVVSASISYYFMNKLGREHIEKCEKVLHDII